MHPRGYRYKRFCCEECFAASNHVLGQISELPLGLRSVRTRPPRTVLIGHGGGGGGGHGGGDGVVVAGHAAAEPVGLPIQENPVSAAPVPPVPDPDPNAHMKIEGYATGTVGGGGGGAGGGEHGEHGEDGAGVDWQDVAMHGGAVAECAGARRETDDVVAAAAAYQGWAGPHTH